MLGLLTKAIPLTFAAVPIVGFCGIVVAKTAGDDEALFALGPTALVALATKV